MKKQVKQIPKRVGATAPPNKLKQAIWERRYFHELLIFCFSFLLFANSIPNDYNLDDELVTMNHRLTSKGISAIPEIFSSPYYEDASGYSYEYRPIVLSSFALEYSIFGDNPHWSHFWNVIFYSMGCIVLYKVLKLLFRNYSPLIAIGVTLIFVAHPAHTEVVSSIKNRDEILGLLFSLLSFYTILKSVLSKNYFLLILAPLIFIAAMMSKVSIVSFIIIIPISLLLFTETIILIVFIVAISLITPSILLLNYGSVFQKLLLIASITGGVITFYILLNFKKIISKIRKIILNLLHTFFSENFGFYEPKLFSIANLKQAFPNKKIVFNPFAVIAILLAYFYYIGFLNKHIQLVLVISAFFLVVTLRGKNQLAWWASIAFYICLFICFTFDSSRHSYLYRDLLNGFLFYQLFFGNRFLLIPHILATTFFIYLTISTGDILDLLFSPLYFLLDYKIIRYVAFAVFSVTQLYHMLNLDNTELYPFLNYGPIFFLIILVVINFRQKKYVADIVWVFPVMIFMISSFSVQNPDSFVSLKKQIDTVTKSVNKINVKIIETKENRPINYIEQCIRHNDSFSIKAGTSFTILLKYLHKTILPYPLSFYYGYKYIQPKKITNPFSILSILLHILLILIAVMLVKKQPIISLGLLIYLFSILLFSNFFIPIPGMIADRFLLIPSLGWSILLVYIITTISKWQELKNLTTYLFAGIFLLYSSLTFSRNLQWKDYLTLFEHDISYVENSSQAHNLLALRLMKKSFEENINPANQLEMRKKAAVHFRRAIEIYPPFFNATYDLGRTYQVLGNIDSAIFYYKKTVLLDSSFTNASLAVGELLTQQNKVNEASTYFEKLVIQSPKDFIGYDKLSYALFLEKKYDESILVLKKATTAIPQNPQPAINLAKLYYSTLKRDSSKIWLERALQIDPSNQEAKGLLQNLGTK